jgi:hypothetical protein
VENAQRTVFTVTIFEGSIWLTIAHSRLCSMQEVSPDKAGDCQDTAQLEKIYLYEATASTKIGSDLLANIFEVVPFN